MLEEPTCRTELGLRHRHHPRMHSRSSAPSRCCIIGCALQHILCACVLTCTRVCVRVGARMSSCVRACAWVCGACVCIHGSVCVYLFAHAHKHVCSLFHVCARACMHVHNHLCVCICACACCVHVHLAHTLSCAQRSSSSSVCVLTTAPAYPIHIACRCLP